MTDVLPDLVAPGLRLVICGTAAGTASARAGAYYAGPGNAFWPTLHAVGLTPRRFVPTEFRLLLDHGIGLTDVAKHGSGSDRAVGSGGFDVPRLVALLERERPALLAFNGKNAAYAALGRPLAYGRQPAPFAGVETFVLPSTSGAARGHWDRGPWEELAAAVRAAAPVSPARA